MRYQIADIPLESFGGIYSLVDEKGKRYIGSSKDIRKRVQFHQTHINLFLRDGVDGYINPSIAEAITLGIKFRCEVLARFYCDLTDREKREIERVFIKKYGGIDSTYNVLPIVHKE